MSLHSSAPFASLLFAFVLLGCNPASVGMATVDYDDALYRPPEDRALLLFAPGTMDRPAIVIDEDGAFVASVRRRMHAIVPVEPGRRSLYVIGPNNIVPLLIDVEAAHVYPIALSAVREMTPLGEKSVLEVLPLGRTSPGFDSFIGDVRGTRPCGLSRLEAERWTREHADEIDDAIRDGRVLWVAGGPRFQAAHSADARRGLSARRALIFARR